MSDIVSQGIRVGQLYSNEEVHHFLGVGNAGGVRVSTTIEGTTRRIVIMTAKPSVHQAKENPYYDRVENDILVYTGAGLEGDQSLGGANKRIPAQVEHGFPVYGFQIIASRRDPAIGARRWRFLGLLEYLRHYPETQIDVRGCVRKVWLFEFRVHAKPAFVFPDQDYAMSRRLIEDSRQENRATDDDESIAEHVSVSGSRLTQFKPEELERVRKQLLSMAPQHFEGFISMLLCSTGYERVRVTKFSQDGGIDVVAYAGRSMWPVQDMMIQLQAKRWLHTVGRKEVAELRGSLEPHARGTLVTTSHYSKAATVEASAPGKVPIVLIDGYSLAGIVKSANLESCD